jgi:hypothetical protein
LWSQRQRRAPALASAQRNSCYVGFAEQDSGFYCAPHVLGNDLRAAKSSRKNIFDTIVQVALPQNVVREKSCLTAGRFRAQWRAVDARCIDMRGVCRGTSVVVAEGRIRPTSDRAGRREAATQAIAGLANCFAVRAESVGQAFQPDGFRLSSSPRRVAVAT